MTQGGERGDVSGLVRQWLGAAGYLSIFLMPALFLIGTATGKTWLAFGIIVIAFPIARIVFGALPAAGAPEWHESVATFLDRLPLAYAAALPVCVVSALAFADASIATDGLALAGVGLSLWMTLLLGTCAAHELIHRRNRRQTLVGSLLAGFCGYPMLAMEHLAHHARPGDTYLAEYPLRTESLWQFTARRIVRVTAEVLGWSSALWSTREPKPALDRTRVALMGTALAALGFAAAGGLLGLLLYLGMIVAVAFGIQLITYIQHWGLGQDSVPDRIAYGRGWEDDCRFQAWVTLSVSLHDHHHRDSRMPYYRLDLSPDSPRLPAGYVLLMFASLVRPLWLTMMRPALVRWLLEPASPLSAGRRITCFGLDRSREQAPV